MKKFNFKTLLLAIGLVVASVQPIWANETYVIGGATSNPKNYNNIGMNLGYKPKGWETEQYKGMNKAQITFEGKYLFVTSYETSSDGNKGKLWNLDFQLMSGSTWQEQWGAISGEADAPSNLIYNYDNHSWYSKLSIGGSNLKAYVYFDATTWNSTTPIKMVVGHANYQKYKELSHVDGTNLYYINTSTLDSWTDAMGWGIVGGDNIPNDGSHWINDIDNADSKTGLKNYGLNNEKTYFVTPKGSNGEEPQVDYKEGGYDDFHYNQTIFKELGTTTTTTNVGTVKVSTYKLSSHGNSTTSEATITSNGNSASAKAVQTATVTLTASANAGYKFEGWAESESGAIVSAEATFTYTATAAKTYYARFSIKSFDVAYTTNDKIYSYSAKPTTAQYNSKVTVTATAIDKYVITGMTTDVVGVTPTCTSGLNTQTATFTFTMPASDIELTLVTALGKVNLNFGAGVHGSLVAKIDDVPQTTGTPINGGSLVDFTATPNPNPGYEVEGWYKESTFNTKIDNSTSTTRQVKADDDVNVYVQFKESDFNITLSKGTGIKDIKVDETSKPSVTAHVDTKTGTITAEMQTGYQWDTWAVTSGSITSESAWTTNGVQINATSAGTLTAKATEIPYTINVQSANTDMGTVNVASVTAKVTTASTTITATPKAGYYFTGWTLPSGVTYKTGSQTATSITVNATATGTVTANFAERWGLVGSLDEGGNSHGGMPGWTNDNAAMFTVNNGNITLDLTLEPNKTYKFQIYDKKPTAKRHGCKSEGDASVITTGESWTLDNSKDVRLRTVGYGTYTITIDKTDADPTDPKISYTAPESHKITMGTKTTSAGCASGSPGTGGTLTAIDGDDYSILDGKYVKNNGTVTFTATPKTGYLFEGFYSDVNCNTLIQAASVGTTYTTTITAATTVYAKFSEILKDVIVIQGDGTQSTVQVGVVSHPEITATAVSGKKFTGWSTNHVTVANANSKTTPITDYSDGYNAYSVTATWGDLDAIYFDINAVSQWWNPSKMYVYFYWGEYWEDKKGTGTGGGGKYTGQYLQMEKVNGDGHFWVAYYDPSEIGGADGISTIQRVAFADKNDSWKDGFFASCTVSYYQFNSCMNMCVLTDDDIKDYSKDGYAYYRNGGFWKNYNTPSSKLYVHLHNEGSEIGTGTELNHAEGDGSYSGSVHIEVPSGYNEYKYYFYIGTCDGNNYSANYKITSTDNSHDLSKYQSLTEKVTIMATATGSYKFIATHNNNNTVTVRVEYPVYENDYRVVTVDNSVNPADVHDNGYLYKYSSEEKDELASFYTKSGMQVKLQKCTEITGTTITWTDITTLAAPATTGIYNYKIHQDGNGNATLSYVGEYTGDFYIRTDVAAGGWNNYKENANNIMVKGDIFGYNNTYDYAYTNWAGAYTDVEYTVANDYSKCISDTLPGDDVIGNNKVKLGDAGANIRFMWNSKTNELKRDYIGGSNDDEKFLLIHGSDNAAAASKTKSKLYETANAASPVDNVKFNDDGNWIYSKEVYVEPGAFAALTAHFNNKTQFFHGMGNAENGEVTTYEQFVGGSGENRLKMKVIYNFKTNELVAGYIPDGETITETIDLHSDLLWIRTQQGNATPINFSNTDVQIENIHKIYGVLEFRKDSMTNLLDNQKQRVPLTNTSYNRINYWISFPFDVRVSEIFGVDGYGEKWVIQYYNGEKRAEIGWFADTPTFWEWLDLDDIMYAGKGYTLNIDPEYFDEPSDDIWKNVDSKVAFYFPSAANYNVNVIKQQEVTTKIPDHAYPRSVIFANDPNKDHKNTDSYWNIIGTPAFQPTTISTASGVQGPKAIYVWKQGDGNGGNGYNIQETMIGFTFQPMRSYIVQYGGNVTWNSVSSIVKAQAPYAYADQKNYMVDLEFYFGEQRDHTYINLSDNATKGFKLNEDVVKMTNSGEPNIYSYAEGYDVAYNEVPMANQTINLGVIARKNGSYTFAMPKDFSGKAILIDLESGEATDLNLSDYTVDLDKGTYNNRFQLLLEVEAKAPTAIDNAKGEWSVDGKTKKLFINDNIYLINAGRIYNASGTKVR
ncbi:MAG: hypothetical protein MJZ20_07915 [Bacteroidaceae bacterium]|nr:hypothetical protein [Bacteroidaceae bacterium]